MWLEYFLELPCPQHLSPRLLRHEAERRKLRVIGTLRVLDDAAAAGLLDLPEALRRLRAAGFYVDATLVQLLLDVSAEGPPPSPRHNARRGGGTALEDDWTKVHLPSDESGP